MFLPPGARDNLIGSTPSGTGFYDGPGGLQIEAVPDQAVVSFERDPAVADDGAVQVLDRPTPASPAAEWVRVLGPTQPLSAGDVPVLTNGACTVRWVTDRRVLAVDDDTGTEIFRAYVLAVQASVDLLGVNVVEATDERAVLNVRLRNTAKRLEMFVTLQRGWTAPRVECYATNLSGSGPAVPSIAIVPTVAGGHPDDRPDRPERGRDVGQQAAVYDDQAVVWQGDRGLRLPGTRQPGHHPERFRRVRLFEVVGHDHRGQL